MKNLGAYVDASFPAWSDYRCSAIGTTAGAIVSGDLTTGSSAPQLIKVQANVTAWLNLTSTGAAVPTTNAVAGQAVNEQIQANWMFQSQIPAGSTGWSIAFLSSGYASLMFLKK